jgi:hypothetical protein
MLGKGATMCLHCNLKAFIDGIPAKIFDESPIDHLRRVHPDAKVKREELAELGRRAAQLFPQVAFTIDDHEFPGEVRRLYPLDPRD